MQDRVQAQTFGAFAPGDHAMEGEAGDGGTAEVVAAVLDGAAPQRIAELGRRGRAVWLRENVAVVLRERAKAAGVSLSAYIENAILELKMPLPPTARIAQPLAQVGYLLAQISASLERADIDGAGKQLREAQRVVADALRPLAREHAREAREMRQDGRGWSG